MEIVEVAKPITEASKPKLQRATSVCKPSRSYSKLTTDQLSIRDSKADLRKTLDNIKAFKLKLNEDSLKLVPRHKLKKPNKEGSNSLLDLFSDL